MIQINLYLYKENNFFSIINKKKQNLIYLFIKFKNERSETR